MATLDNSNLTVHRTGALERATPSPTGPPSLHSRALVDCTAGFAASIAIRQELLQRFVRELYNAGAISPALNIAVPTLNASLFMSLPELALTSANGGRCTLELFAWGPMTVTPPLPRDSPAEARRVTFRGTVQVPPTVTVENGQLLLGLESSAATLLSYQIDPYAGGAFSANTVDYLNGRAFATLLEEGLQGILAQLGQSLPPLDASFLGTIATDPSAQATAVALDQALALGIDVSIPAADPLPGVTTQGDPTRLVDSSGGNDIGIWTNPRVVRVAYQEVETTIRDQIAEQGATLDSFGFEVEEGWFTLSGRASTTGGAVDFSVHAVPKLIRPGTYEEFYDEAGRHVYTTPDREEIWFDPQDVVVDIDRDWWVVVLEVIVGIITRGIGVLVVEAIVAMIRGKIVSGMSQDGPTLASRNQEFTISGCQIRSGSGSRPSSATRTVSSPASRSVQSSGRAAWKGRAGSPQRKRTTARSSATASFACRLTCWSRTRSSG